MRKVLGRVVLVCVAVIGIAFAGPAAAKKGNKGDEGIIPTGIVAFDRVFDRVGAIDRRLKKSERQLRQGKKNFNTALGLPKKTPIATGIAELKQRGASKLKLAANGKVPQLTYADGVPTDVRNAAEAANAMVGNFSTTIAELAGIAPEIVGIVAEVRNFPANLQREFAAGHAGLFKKLFGLPKAAKALAHDLKVTKDLPVRAANVTRRMTEVVGAVAQSFGGKKPARNPGGPKKGKDARKGRGGAKKGKGARKGRGGRRS